jgi:hypothetical protein
MNDQQALYSVSPQLIERKCGGWLAITPRGWPLSIGVCGDTKDAAKVEFEAALLRWSQIDLTLTGQACGK